MTHIRHVTQLNNSLTNDCAWACMAMLVQAHTGKSPTIEQLATRHGVPNKFTTVAQLVKGLNAEGVKATNTRAATFDWYVEKWEQDIAIAGLLAMHKVTDNDGFPWAHWAILTGRSKGLVKINNPLKLKESTIPEAQFINAINMQSEYIAGYDASGKAIKGYNYTNQAVYPIVPAAAPIPLFANAIDAVAARVRLEATG
jgi:ABC-type bacteriocin/lantibiotic exporter with double-glycine peptidase domain